MALERGLGKRGPVSRSLTKWLLKNAYSLRHIAMTNGWDNHRLVAEVAAYFQNGDMPDHARAIERYGIQQTDAECDARLLACLILLGLNRESVEERAAILEFDGGMSRYAANRKAVALALCERQPGISEDLASAFFDHAADILDVEITNGWARAETIEELIGSLYGHKAKYIQARREAV